MTTHEYIQNTHTEGQRHTQTQTKKYKQTNTHTQKNIYKHIKRIIISYNISRVGKVCLIESVY